MRKGSSPSTGETSPRTWYSATVWKAATHVHPRSRTGTVSGPTGRKAEEGNWRYQEINGAMMCLAQVIHYDLLYAVNQLARAMSKPVKPHMGAAKHLLRYLAGSKKIPTTFKQGGSRFAALSDAN